eukprot:9143751-Lingulodinium_polyedra.AAC.1
MRLQPGHSDSTQQCQPINTAVQISSVPDTLCRPDRNTAIPHLAHETPIENVEAAIPLAVNRFVR